jgi:hypothetical protein
LLRNGSFPPSLKYPLKVIGDKNIGRSRRKVLGGYVVTGLVGAGVGGSAAGGKVGDQAGGADVVARAAEVVTCAHLP